MSKGLRSEWGENASSLNCLHTETILCVVDCPMHRQLTLYLDSSNRRQLCIRQTLIHLGLELRFVSTVSEARDMLLRCYPCIVLIHEFAKVSPLYLLAWIAEYPAQSLIEESEIPAQVNLIKPIGHGFYEHSVAIGLDPWIGRAILRFIRGHFEFQVVLQQFHCSSSLQICFLSG